MRKLQVVKGEEAFKSEPLPSQKQLYVQSMCNHYERWWLIEPKEKKHPLLTAKGRERIERTFGLIEKNLELSSRLSILDLGCGDGTLLKKMPGIRIGVDTAINALKALEESGVNTLKVALPYLPYIKEGPFDLVICSDLIGSILPSLHRLLVSEIAAQVKREGKVICSTPVEINSEDSLFSFVTLLQTEFEIVQIKESHHRLHCFLISFFLAPQKFIRASSDGAYRKRGLEKRHSLTKGWYFLNSQPWVKPFWKAVAILFNPILSFLEQSKKGLLLLEWLSKTIWGERGITHLICLCSPKKM